MSDESRQNILNRLRIQKDLEKFTAGALARHPNLEELIAAIAALERDEQDQIYRSAELVARTNNELAAQFIAKAPAAFHAMGGDGVQEWLDGAIQVFDHRGLGFAVDFLEDIDSFAEAYAGRHAQCMFDQASVFLRHFVRGLGGRELRIATDEDTYTDTEGLYLPASFNVFPDAEQNFTLYKLTAVHLWAQTWYGTWRYQVLEKLMRHFDTDKVLPIFNRLECIRLDACLARELPGVAREMAVFGCHDEEEEQLWAQWREAAPMLASAAATAEDSLALIPALLGSPLPPLKLYQGEMFAGKVRQAMFARIEREKSAFQRAMEDMRNEGDGPEGAGADAAQKQMVDMQPTDNEDGSEANLSMQVSMDGKLQQLPEHLKDLVGSILQDFGEIPDEHMERMDLGEYSDDLLPQNGDNDADGNADLSAEGSFSYREWDCVRNRFREGFCTLRELTVPPGDERFVEETLEKHRGLMKSIKKTFEAVLGESKLQRRQSDGDDIDLDAVIEAYADVANGREMSEYLYTRYRNQERNIAVMFMVDMSGSTLGWVNDAERESLVLLCEALELLGDRYAIYGFSGRTNKRCEVYKIKEFDESYNLEVRQRISGIRPKAYTRMGVAIRHLGHLLHETRARTKLLITLSDGRPEDYGGYKGKYGIEDTRHALLETRQGGIHSFCITIDNEAQEYLPHMYGPANYAVIDEVQKLPYKVADIYRRLTT
ncbi:MAG: nitric oxide reductase activation protein [Gammaproteobacteria bacterium]|nr:nitric oxide reductase activation protein [Gammaproteobacteria bacterium]